jgi:rhodanese-related sulfurtransferase
MRARLPALAVALTGALLLAGCGGSGESSGSGPRLAGPDEFAAAVAEPGRVTINVHVPDEGSIAGTDLSIPFDRIAARKSVLPGTSTPLAVYCRSGHMSAIAVRTLARLGYRDVVELEGGMVAWEAAGKKLLSPGG